MTELSGIRPPAGAPKIEGKKNFNRKPARHAGLVKKDFVSKVVGLESHTFDVGEAKYAACTRNRSMLLPTTSRRITREDLKWLKPSEI
jgi:hypothetical protein